MIPVTLQPEPADFDAKVRRPGLRWLASRGIAVPGPMPKGTKLPAYWSKTNEALWDVYGGTCAYLAIYFDLPTGANSTDHFVPKSIDVGLAYEWSNYRLSCLSPNRNKSNFRDVLDPSGLANETFVLNLSSGEIKPNPALSPPDKTRASKTIKRLKLDSPRHNAMRQLHFQRYARVKDEQTLKELSPFVWYEAQRQGLL